MSAIKKQNSVYLINPDSSTGHIGDTTKDVESGDIDNTKQKKPKKNPTKTSNDKKGNKKDDKSSHSKSKDEVKKQHTMEKVDPPKAPEVTSEDLANDPPFQQLKFSFLDAIREDIDL